MPFQIIRNDITKVKADAIVNTEDPAAGVGEAAITPAFDLPARFIIHSSAPKWEGGLHNEERLLKQCYDKALELAYKNDCRSIAFPLMAAGTNAFPKELGLQIAVDSFKNFLEEHEIDIMLVVYTGHEFKVSGGLYDNVASFIDGSYVKKALAAEEMSAFSSMSAPMQGSAAACPMQGAAAAYPMQGSAAACPIPEETADYSDEEPAEKSATAHKLRHRVRDTGTARGKAKSLDTLLKDIYTDSFEKHLQKLINKKGLKNAEVYAAANISKQYFSKLLKGQVKPSKEKMLALAVGLRLNLDETIDFLKLAGYALSPISQTDAVVEFFIENKDYNVLKIDIVLFDYGLEPLSKT